MKGRDGGVSRSLLEDVQEIWMDAVEKSQDCAFVCLVVEVCKYHD